MDKQTAEQFAEIWKILKENADLSRQTRQTLDELAVQSKDTDRKLAELAEESRQTRRTLDELAEQSKETDRKLAELAEMSKGTRRELDELAAQSRETKRKLAEFAEESRQIKRELAAQSKETDRKFAELAEQSRQTKRELAEQSKQTKRELAEQSKETDRKLAKLAEESAEESRQLKRELAEQSKQTRRALDELAAQSKETARYMKESNRRLEGLGLVQGEIAEELFYRTIKEAMAKQGIIIDEVLSSLEVKGIGEYDIVAVNRTSAFVFEIKNKLKMDHLEKLHKVQLPRFREAFPEYKDHKLYAGVGALVVKEHIEKQARKLGFYVLTQGGKDNTVLHKPSSPRIF